MSVVKDGKAKTKTKLTPKQVVIMAALERGLSTGEAAKLAGASQSHAHKVRQKVSQGLLDSLASKAKRAIRTTLEGQAVGEADAPHASDVLAAAKLVVDRVQPAVQRQDIRSLNVHMDISDTDRAKWRSLLGLVSGPERAEDAPGEALDEPGRVE